MPYNMVVLVKQVPDTKNITGEAMKEDGTVNRAALPAIFNPEDLNALELALQIKDEHGGKITVLTMGLPSAAEVLRQSLYRGADEAYLLTDIKFARADTLATSFALSTAIHHLGDFDLVICGLQAIDGDTAQVGPQTAEKLGVPQVTYVDKVLKLDGDTIEVERSIEGGFEKLRSKLPILLTVTGEANEPRPQSAKLLMQYKRARCPLEVHKEVETQLGVQDDTYAGEGVDEQAARIVAELEAKGLLVKQLDAAAINADPDRIGGNGSPTMVKKIESVVLKAGEFKDVPPTDDGVNELIHELIADHTIG